MKDAVKDLAERTVEVIDLHAPVLGLHASGWPHYAPRETPADLIALAAPDSHVTPRAIIQEFPDLLNSCVQMEEAGLSHASCLYSMVYLEFRSYLEEFDVEWDPELRF